MLQIIFFILKILGWILLIVLGLLVLVFLLVLFTPLRYQVKTSCKGKLSALEAEVRFHILFHLVSGSVCYEEKKLAWNIRAAWIKLGDSGDESDIVKTEETDTEKISQIVEKEIEETTDEKPDETEKIIEETSDEKPDEAERELEETVDEDLHPVEKKLEKLSDIDTDTVGSTKEAANSQKKTKSDSEENENSGHDSFFDKITSVFEKIKYTFSRIYDKIKALSKKVEEIRAFLEDQTHQAAFWKLLAELKKLLFRMRPKQFEGNLKFGFDDPSVTGKVLAGLSMLYAYWELQLEPDFEHKVLDGNVSVKGSVRLWPAAVLAWNMLWNRDVRRTVLDIKKIVFK